MNLRISRSIVPNFFTVMNVFCGFLCIVQTAEGHFIMAGMYIVFGALCDTLDGLMARLTKSASDFGVELDSLADVVSFGLAPSYLIYALVLRQFGPAGQLLAAAPLIAGALRLARFNVQIVGYHKDHFTGLPIPLAALTIVSYVFFFRPDAIRAALPAQYGLIALTLLCALLMVSTIRYPVFPKLTPRALRAHPLTAAGLLAAAAALAVSPRRVLFPLLLAIVLSGVLTASYRLAGRLLRRRRRGDAEEHSGKFSTFDTH